MQPHISHDLQDEMLEAKTRWFKSLSIEERMEFLCNLVDMILEVNPHFIERLYAQPITRNICVLSKA